MERKLESLQNEHDHLKSSQKQHRIELESLKSSILNLNSSNEMYNKYLEQVESALSIFLNQLSLVLPMARTGKKSSQDVVERFTSLTERLNNSNLK